MKTDLNFPLQLKSLDASGTFVGLASVYNNIDYSGEVVLPGAFTKTIAERPRVKVLYQHNTHEPIGIGEVSDSADGLVIRGKLTLSVSRARETYELLKAGVLDSLSIGYDVIKDAVQGRVRKLSELRLWEVSIVTFPANALATIGSVKHGADVDDEFANTLRRQLAEISAKQQRGEINAWIALSNARAARHAARMAAMGR